MSKKLKFGFSPQISNFYPPKTKNVLSSRFTLKIAHNTLNLIFQKHIKVKILRKKLKPKSPGDFYKKFSKFLEISPGDSGFHFSLNFY